MRVHTKEKYEKLESVNTQNDYETTIKKRTVLSCVFIRSGKVRKGGALIHRMITKQRVKK